MRISKIGTQTTRKSMALLIGFVDGNMAGTMQGMRTCPSAAHNIWYASLSVFTLAYITYNQPSWLSTSARERGLAKAEQQSEGTGKRKGIGNTRDHVIGALGLYRQTLESLEPQSFICKTCKIRLSMAIQAQLVSVGAGLLKGNHYFPTVLFAVILCDHALNPVDWLTIVETCGNSNWVVLPFFCIFSQ